MPIDKSQLFLMNSWIYPIATITHVRNFALEYIFLKIPENSADKYAG